MRFDWRQFGFAGFGELLCLILAWTLGIVALWSDYAGKPRNAGGDNVAVSGSRRGDDSHLQ